MDAALTSTDLAEIAEALEDYGSVTCWAIRVVDAADSFDMDARLPRSRVSSDQLRALDVTERAECAKIRETYRIGQRLRPCPGCLGCSLFASGFNNFVRWCDGSAGVLPARARKVRR